jgi:hypothetical protein
MDRGVFLHIATHADRFHQSDERMKELLLNSFLKPNFEVIDGKDL